VVVLVLKQVLLAAQHDHHRVLAGETFEEWCTINNRGSNVVVVLVC
jgi:hypothetical protein